jgi:hypothetical protein
VTARTSSFAFKGKEIGSRRSRRLARRARARRLGAQVRQLGADHGAADQRGTDTHLWSQTYDRKLDDIFAIQDEIAADVVKQLKVTLLGAAPQARTTDPEAYALYLQAVQVARQNNPEAYQAVRCALPQGVGIDPRYAPAWDQLARNSVNKASAGAISNDEAYRQAREFAERALAIDPDYAPAHARLGSYRE